jgi:DNA replication protein DnaC
MAYNLAEMSPLKRFWLTRQSNIPQRYWGFDAQDITRDTGSFPKVIDVWLDDVLNGDVIKSMGKLGYTGVGLLFDGKPGRGKTTHAVTALTEFLLRLPDDDAGIARVMGCKTTDVGHKFRAVYFLTMNELLTKKKAAFDADSDERRELHYEMEGFHGRSTLDHLNVRLLVLDDLGKEYGSKYDDFSFDDVLRSRYDKGLPTIITTNKPRETWGTAYSEAMGSFAHEAFRRVKLDGIDLRKGR